MDDAQLRIDTAPLPGAQELRRRSTPVGQFLRFLRLNWTMYRLANHRH